MNDFSGVGAWAKGFRFFSGHPGGHALFLIGLAVVAPFLLHYLLVGRSVGMLAGAGAPGAGMTDLSNAGIAMLIATVGGYFFQTAAYLGSWRLGFAPGESLGRALVFALVASLLVVLASMLLVAALGSLGFLVTALGVFGAICGLVLVFAAFFTAFAVMIGVGLIVLLLLAMAFGAAVGNVGYAATLAGGSGFVVVMLVVFGGVILWLAARLSCTAAVMAERRSFNPLAAMVESWRVTGEEQFRILAYLTLIGLGLVVAAFGFAIAAGIGIAAAGRSGTADLGVAGDIVTVLIGIPFAYLTVLIPAGILRELTGATGGAAEIFA